MRYPSRFIGALASGLAVLCFGFSIQGCDQDEGEPCDEGEIGVESCDVGQPIVCRSTGVWDAFGDRCLASEQCIARGGNAACIDDDCRWTDENFCLASVGESECDGTVLRMCEETDCPMWTSVDCAASGLLCTIETSPPSCVDGAGGTGGTGGTAGSGGTAGGGGTAGMGGGTGSCMELDIAGQPNINGPFSISPSNASPDDFVTVTVGVDGDTEEVTAIFRNANSSIVGGTGFATTSGNETVLVDVLIGTVADPGPHVVDFELRADASNRLDYIFYTPGDGDTYVRIEVENNVPGPETATPCLLLNCDIQF